MDDEAIRQLLLLGEDYPVYDAIELRAQRGGASVVALTVGADPLSPSRLHKGRAEIPNEDGVLLVDAGALTVLAVADGHHGHEASHWLLRRLAESLEEDGVPANPLELLGLIWDSTDVAPENEYPAATTLLVAVWDRDSGSGFGASFGDSTLAVFKAAEVAARAPTAPTTPAPAAWGEGAANLRNTEFVSPRFAASLDPRRAREFEFHAEPGDLVLAFTDGVDGCHYGHPETSVAPAHLTALWAEAAGDVAGFVRRAVELALAGVGGQPGGQDNIAVAATRV